MKKNKAVTIQDVAKEAGVSVSTVSRVLNGKVDVATDTQERISRVIDELGYTTNLAARSMRSRKTNLIGLIMPDLGQPYSIEIMKGVNSAILDTEFDLLVYTTGDVQRQATAEREQKYVSLLSNSITDGIIIVAPIASEFITGAPLVSVDPGMAHTNYPCVHGKNYAGAVDAMQYLLELGHRRIGFIAGRPELESSNRRLSAYQDSLAQAGIPFDPALVAYGDFTTRKAIELGRQLLSAEPRPTAIFASNDQSAIGVLQVAEEMGLAVPEDLSVIGFDNIPEAQYWNLTTIDQNLTEMGAKAMQMLIKEINEGNLDAQRYQMDTKLIVRGSCGKPEGGD